MKIKLRLPVIALLFVAYSSFAQDNRNSVEITPLAGVKIFSAEKNTLKGNIWGAEAAYHFNMTENKANYVRIFNIKSLDAVLTYHNMEQVVVNGDPTTKGLLGSTVGLLGRFEIGLLKVGPTQLLLTPGAGVLYSTQTYFTDNRNPIVGSHINFAAQTGLKLYTAVSSSTGIQAGFDIYHYSNGAVRLPNNGVNTYSVSLGVVQKVDQTGPATQSNDEGYNQKHSFEIGGDIGARGVFKSREVFYKSGLYAGYNYRLSPVISLKVGVDAVYYFTVFNPDDYLRTFQSDGTSYDRWRVGTSIGTDVWFGKLALMANYGRYLHYRTFFVNKWYWTAGLKYYVKPWVALQARGYIHRTQADYVGYGLLFRI
jgi:hypothetical protein